jgi:hypothetical protein
MAHIGATTNRTSPRYIDILEQELTGTTQPSEASLDRKIDEITTQALGFLNEFKAFDKAYKQKVASDRKLTPRYTTHD